MHHGPAPSGSLPRGRRAGAGLIDRDADVDALLLKSAETEQIVGGGGRTSNGAQIGRERARPDELEAGATRGEKRTRTSSSSSSSSSQRPSFFAFLSKQPHLARSWRWAGNGSTKKGPGVGSDGGAEWVFWKGSAYGSTKAHPWEGSA